MPQAGPIIGHLAAVAYGEPVVVQYHYNLKVVEEEIWLWDQEEERHVLTTPEEMSQVLIGWEEEAATFDRILLPVTLQAFWFPTWQRKAA